MADLSLNCLPDLPQCQTIVEVGNMLWADAAVVALWIGGSLASGAGDRFSDVDFRVAVAPDQLVKWQDPPFARIFARTPVVGRILLALGDDALLHHLVLSNGEIFDFFVQSTARQPGQEPLLILGCHSQDFEQMLLARNNVPHMARQAVSGEMVLDLLVNFWVSSHKHRKVLARDLDLLATLGLHLEQSTLLRLWYIEASGQDCGELRRQTIHSLTELVRTIEQAQGAPALALIGEPVRDRQELCRTIEETRQAVALSGHRLAERYAFAYPSALETTVLQGWLAFLTG